MDILQVLKQSQKPRNKEDNMNISTVETSETMTSTQLSELLGYEKKEINRKIKSLFKEKIDGGLITPSLDSRGYVIDYNLPELESKMFVAMDLG